MLSVKNIKVSFSSKTVLKGITFNVARGERLVIVGESGCGKTTLLKTISGLIQASEGSIWFNNEKVKGPDEQLVPGHPKIKLVNQDFGLDNFHSVEENIRLRLLQYNKEYIIFRIEELLKVTGLYKYKNQLAHQLSGGQKQRLAIARALADEPDLLLLDEPFNQLDYFLRQKIENYIDEYISRHQITLIMVSHNGEETMRWGEKVLFLNNGKKMRIDTPVSFYNYPQNKKEAGFFGVINTVLFKGKYISFRPHNFSLVPDESFPIKLNITLEKVVNKGWYFDHLIKYGKKTIHIYHPSLLNIHHSIYVKPLF